jgi:phosphate transport system substrate-binding protein
MRSAVVPGLVLLGLAVGLFQPGPALAQDGRDFIRVIGRPETLVYAAAAAEALGRTARRKFPQLEQSSDEGARRTFCTSARDSPDIMLMAIIAGEGDGAICGGSVALLRLPLGRQVMVAYSAAGTAPFTLTREQLYRAIARELPRRGGDGSPDAGFERNPNQRWRDIAPDLPDVPIRLLVPPRRAVEWLTIEDLIMRPGCRAVPAVAALGALDQQAATQRCLARRTDAALVYADAQAYALKPEILPKPGEVALNERRYLGFVAGAVPLPIEGALADPATLDSGRYPLARDIVAVVKRSRLDAIPNLRNFLVEVTSPAAVGPGGYLLKAGLDPLPEMRRGRSALEANYALPGQPVASPPPAPGVDTNAMK